MTPIQSLMITLMSFCRISGFLMIAPGFSVDRIPILLRLYLSLAISVFSGPLIGTLISFNPTDNDFYIIPQLIINEFIVGFFYGFVCRIFIFALETTVTAFCYTIGLSNIFGTGVIDTEASPVLSSFIVITLLQLIFTTDLHLFFIQGIINSYRIIPFHREFDSSRFFIDLINSISQSYLLVLRISSPILLFSIIVNLLFAFLSKLSPNIPVYFVSGPCVILLGVIFFTLHTGDFFSALIFSLREIVLRG